MLFTTPEFFIFLIIVIASMELIRKQFWQHAILLAASYFFYWWSGSIHILLLAGVTLASYFCGAKVFKAQTKKAKRIWLAIGTIIPLAVLAYFKYIDWGIISINSLLGMVGIGEIPLLNIALPVGISFFTFQALSYVFDIYLGKIEHEEKFSRYALFIAFFPGLVAGPIVRASEFLPQLKSKIVITRANIKIGVTLIIWGLFKKMVIADNVSQYVNIVYGNVSGYPSLYILAATILFGIQIYCDFSGYANIAIGCAKILGLTLPENFNLPYLAHSVQDFWHKWHMTLSRFIQDYVYIPLGGNRKGHVRTYVNLIAAMLLCGLWHGAAWTFVIWGGYHGILLAAHRFLVKEKRIGTKSRFLASSPGLLIKILITQIFVFIGWMIFRVQSLEELGICVQKIIFFDFSFTTATRLACIACIAGVIVLFLLMCNKRIAGWIHTVCYFDYLGFCARLRLQYWIIYIALVVGAILLLSPPETAEFIYFAF
ncbi:MAG: MBOAT family O-acyltransferase [Methanocorpusculum sp.]|nr:MBOAT family O-acyltransferase [Methanocorpusculum sp.]